MSRSLRLLVELFAGLIGILVVLGVLLVWRLSMSPITSTFLKPYVESAAERLVPGARADIANAVLTWDNADRSVTLHVDGVRLSGKEGEAIAEVPSLDIRVSVIGFLLGRLVPAALRVEHPQIWLVRTPDGRFLFGELPAGESGTGGNIKNTLTNIADDLAHAFFMRKLQVNQVVVAVHDQKTSSNWSIEIPEIKLEHRVGRLAGEAEIRIMQQGRVSPIAIDYTYDYGRERHNLSAHFSGINPSFWAGTSKAAILNVPLTGDISFGFDHELEVVTAAGDIRGGEGVLNDPDFWDLPRAVKSLDLKADYDRKTGKLDLSNVTVDFGGPKLVMSLTGAPPESAGPGKPHDLDFELSMRLSALPMDGCDKIWPKPAIANPRAWITANLSKGVFDHAEASLKGWLNWDDLENMQITQAKGKVAASGATVRYIDGMPQVGGVNANADFDLDHMTVKVSGGGIGDIRLEPSTIELMDFQKPIQNIDLPVKISGPIPAVLKLLDVPRLGYATAVGLAPDSVKGRIEGTLRLRFPLLNSLEMKAIDVSATANVINLSSSSLLQGFDISQGNLTLDLDKTAFTLKGPAALDKVPLQVSWQRALGKDSGKPYRQATISGNVNGEQWALLGVSPLEKTRGAVAATLTVLQQEKTAPILLSGDLDMRAADMDVDVLSWKKAAGKPAGLKFSVEVPQQGDIRIKSIDMQGDQVNIKGSAVLTAGDMGLAALDLDPIVIGRTDATLHFSQAPGDNGKLLFEAKGASFDVTGLRGGKEPKQADPRPKEYRLKLDKLYTSDFGFISKVEGRAVRDRNGWSEISLHGMADGAHKLDIDLAAKDRRRVFSIRCDDFGKALKGLGFTDTVKDGELEVTGSSTPENPRIIRGKMKIGHFAVTDLPVLALLMNATSPFGLFTLFAGTMEFEDLSGKFLWQGDQLELAHVRASGSGAGMTIEGKVDMNSGQANLNGTMAPFNLFNRIVGAIPLIGDMITGGDGQGMLAVAYTVKGPLAEPEVSVNPISLLTPGFLRNLFFGADDSDDDAPEKQKPAVVLPPAKTGVNTNINKGK